MKPSDTSRVSLRWLGIGAQRCGTTWFVDLLTQHPEVVLPRSGVKELHLATTSLFVESETVQQQYIDAFTGVPGSAPGEFTPAYLRSPWVIPVVRDALAANAPLIILLRDPIDRFESAIRYSMRSGNPESRFKARRLGMFSKSRGGEAIWAGMYAAQLNAWSTEFPRDQLHITTFEEFRLSPHEFVKRVWERMGLDPVELHGLDQPSRSSNRPVDHWSFSEHPGFREWLINHYRQDVEQLSEQWHVDTSTWRNFGR